MAPDESSGIQEGFGRQARAFARSPLHRDPGRLRRLIEFMAIRPGDRVLDVACGPGIVTAALVAEGARAIGIDLTREMLAEAARGAGGYVRGDALRLPFPDRAFDVAVCRNSLHHFVEPGAVLAEMARVVRPGGRVVVEDMEAPDDAGQREYHESIERLRDSAHVRTLTRDDVRSCARAAGLAGTRELPARMVIDFEEWIDRAYPSAGNRERALRMLEACVGNDRCGLRVWRDDGRLRFERRSLLFAAERPA